MTGKAELVSYSDTTRSSMSARPGRSEWDSSDSDSTEPAVAAPVVNAVAVDASDAELARRFNAPDLLLDPSIVDGHNALRMAMAVGMTLPHLSQWDCPLQYTVHTGSLSTMRIATTIVDEHHQLPQPERVAGGARCRA